MDLESLPPLSAEPAPGPVLPETPPAAPARLPPSPRGHPIVRAILYLVTFVLLQVGIAFLIRGLAILLDDRFLPQRELADAPELVLVWVTLQAPLVIGLTFLFVRFLDRRALASVGLRWPVGGRRAASRQLVVTPLGAIALIAFWVGLILLLPDRLAALRLGGVSETFLRGRAWWPLPPGLLLLLLLVLFLIQGGVEELVTRGYLYHALRERWRPWLAALVSSALFALFHLFNPDFSALAMINILLAGMILAALVERTGSLWSATLAHGVWNFVLSCLLSLPVSGIRIFHLLDVTATGNQRLTGDGFGPEGSLVLTLLGVPLALALWRGAGRNWTRGDVRDTAPSTPEDVAPGGPLEDPLARSLLEASAEPKAAASGGPPT